KSSIPVIAGINDSACHRLVAELRQILPDGSVIFPGGNRIEIQSYNLSKMNQEFQGVFFGQLQRILTQVPEGNFKLLATHSLFEAISFSLKIEDENCKAQFNKIKGVIASAVLNGCKAIPDLSALTLDASSLPADIQSLLQQISQEVNFACEIASLAESLKRKLSFWGSPETPSSGYSQVPTSELTKNSSVTAQSGRTPSPPKESRLLSFFTGFKTSDDTPQQSPETNDKDNESVFAFSGT
nr:hypothetical protein [Gammaproteobacteria bacterium]